MVPRQVTFRRNLYSERLCANECLQIDYAANGLLYVADGFDATIDVAAAVDVQGANHAQLSLHPKL